MVDSLRADALTDYGYERNTNPALSEYGLSGARFEPALSHSSHTKISMASVFTGLLPPAHQVRRAAHRKLEYESKVVSDVLAPERRTLTEVLEDHGYETAAVVTNPHLRPAHGFDQGFDHYVYLPLSTPAEDVNDTALGLVDSLEEPWFLYLHYMDVHAPYHPPQPYRGLYTEPKSMRPLMDGRYLEGVSPGRVEYSRALYDGQINYWDESFRKFMASLRAEGLLDNTVVVVFGDHGEEFFEHRGFGHGRTLYGEVLEVPLYIVYEGGPKPAAPEGPSARLIDLFPTVLGLCGINEDGLNLHGRDLFAPPSPRAWNHYSEVYTQKSPGRDKALAPRSVSDGRHKFIHDSIAGRRELYDLAADPGETENIFDPELPEVSRLKRSLAAIETLAAGSRGQSREAGPEEVRELKSLGYIE